MNVAAYGALKKVAPVQYIGPIDPPVDLPAKTLSKLMRTAGLRGSFSFFSARRLSAIAAEVDRRCSNPAALDFFHGFTPWILTKPRGRYIAWSDCTFRDYIDTYHDRSRFDAADLVRIEAAEAAWLKGAAAVLLTSDWAARRAVRDYGLDADRVHSVGIFGESTEPDADAYDGGRDFVFVSTDFAAKGGDVVLAAVHLVQRQWPDARLIVIGERPVAASAASAGVVVLGFLRKEVPAERRLFEQTLAGARALVHPTRSDIAPLLLVEAGYFGCPVVATRRAAIPELVDDGVGGILIDDPTDPQRVAAAMIAMLADEDNYQAMRRQARQKALQQNSRRAFEQRLTAHVMAGTSGHVVEGRVTR